MAVNVSCFLERRRVSGTGGRLVVAEGAGRIGFSLVLTIDCVLFLLSGHAAALQHYQQQEGGADQDLQKRSVSASRGGQGGEGEDQGQSQKRSHWHTPSTHECPLPSPR